MTETAHKKKRRHNQGRPDSGQRLHTGRVLSLEKLLESKDYDEYGIEVNLEDFGKNGHRNIVRESDYVGTYIKDDIKYLDVYEYKCNRTHKTKQHACEQLYAQKRYYEPYFVVNKLVFVSGPEFKMENIYTRKY